MPLFEAYPEIAAALEQVNAVSRQLAGARYAQLTVTLDSGKPAKFTDGIPPHPNEAAHTELSGVAEGATFIFNAFGATRPEETYSGFLYCQCEVIFALLKSYRDKQEIIDLFFQSENQLKELMVLQNAILSGAGYAIIAADSSGRITVFNAAAEALTGITKAAAEAAESITTLPFSSHIGEEFPQGEREEYLTRKGGIAVPVQVFRSSFQQPGGSAQGKLLIAADITRRTVAEEKQKLLMAELEEINRQLNDFAHVVSHDLKAPLRGIASLAEWLAEDYAPQFDDEGKKNLAQLRKRVKKMGALIDGILSYSRLSRAKESAVMINSRTLVQEVLELMEVPPHFRVMVTGDFPVLLLERTKLFQVFQNLLSNAVRYNDKPEGLITIYYSGSEGKHQFGVRDNGPGIPEDKGEQVFQLFKTLSPSDEGGTGIGLSVVRKIIEGYGGKVWCNTAYQDGAEFCFTLPAAAVIAPEAS